MSFRNRCVIAGGEGPIDLSIPLVKGRDQKTMMRDVRIAGDKDWQGQHWKTIVSCYNRSPWFEYYRDDLEALYRKKMDFLIDWNLACYEWMHRTLGMKQNFGLTEEFVADYSEAGDEDVRSVFMAKSRLSMDMVGWSGRGDWVRYRQVFEERTGFLPNLSILDLLFCEGKRARQFLD